MSFSHSEQLDQLAPALVAVQAAGLVAVEHSRNSQVNATYADLGDVWACIREPLRANGLAVTQLVGRVKAEGGQWVMGVRTMLIHTSGQWIAGDGEIIAPQSKLSSCWWIGSAISYLRRYGLCAILGVVTGDDNDAQGVRASEPEAPKEIAARWPEFLGAWEDVPSPKHEGRTLGELTEAERRQFGQADLVKHPAVAAMTWDRIALAMSNSLVTYEDAKAKATGDWPPQPEQLEAADIIPFAKAIATLLK